MWSDRIAAERLEAMVAKLRSVLPRPRRDAASINQKVEGTASIEQVAELLHNEPGFAWLGNTLFHRPLATVTYLNGNATVTGPEETITLSGKGFDILEAALEAWRGAPNAVLAGFVSYDLANELEEFGPRAPETFDYPEFHFGLYDSALTFDENTWSLVSTDAWRTPLSGEAAEDLIQRAGTTEVRMQDAVAHHVLTTRPDRAFFEASVKNIVATIHAGDIFQTNLCRSIETQLDAGAAWEVFRRMRAINPAQYEAFLRVESGALLSISPELFLKVSEGVVESRPIKGTRPRALSAERDEALAKELLASEKDRAELAMIVDVVRNDLGRVCETGSVEVVNHAALMSLPTVHHLFSTVRGRLRADRSLADLLRAAFPAASITGAPKIEAMRVAAREEGQRRGPCMGAIGWISLDGRMELSVAIRTAFVSGGTIRYYAGCGITADSVPATEFEESEHKAAAFVRALGFRA